MKIKLMDILRTFDGQPLVDKDPKGNIFELNVKTIVLEALLRVHAADDRLSGIDKMKRFDLAKRVFDTTEEIDLSHEDIILLKEAIGLKLPVLIVGQMYKILDGK